MHMHIHTCIYTCTHTSMHIHTCTCKHFCYNVDFAMMQRYTIRDLNTGQLYVLDGDASSASPDGPESPAAAGRVTDVIQGRQLSLDEFEQLLGLNAVLEVLPKAEHVTYNRQT